MGGGSPLRHKAEASFVGSVGKAKRAHQPRWARRIDVEDGRNALMAPLPTLGLGKSGQILLEPIERALPGELGGGFVVAGRGVVMEAVIGAHIDEAFVRHLGLRELLVEGGPAGSDARV